MTQTDVLTNINSLLQKKEEYLQTMVDFSEKAKFGDTDDAVVMVEEYLNKRQAIIDEIDKLDKTIETCSNYLDKADPSYDEALFRRAEDCKAAIRKLVLRCIESDKKNTLDIERLADRVKVEMKDFHESKRVNKQYQYEVKNNDGVFFDKKH